MAKGRRNNRAKAAASAMKSAVQRERRLRRTVHFYKPKVQTQAREPKYQRKAVPRASAKDTYQLIEAPVTTEHAMKKIEDENTLVFLVNKSTTKSRIKQAIKDLYDVDIKKVNTLIRPDGCKIAYVKLTTDFDALDVANKIGII
jgi:large subunit ribosomal protein L23Ae